MTAPTIDDAAVTMDDPTVTMDGTRQVVAIQRTARYLPVVKKSAVAP